ncbi:MAG: curli production assembly protein CsgG [Acetobacteraceae bacterium]|nr:MAG: curli production assembly protein CsgG [Acetobacteraceae bacterium]
MTYRTALMAIGLLGLSACGTSPARMLAESPTLGVRTVNTNELRNLPAPKRKLDVAVFAFQDQTGQYRPNNNFAEYSFAVTQGGASILINALKDAGRSQWFSVLERNRLPDLFQERQIIRANRSESVGPDGRPMAPISQLRNAGIMVTGGIVGYDSNVLTGGAGANFLGIGASTEYRRDNVSVFLRAVSVMTGEVLVSITTDKTIYSVGVNGTASKYVGFNRLLQIEGGVTTNEPRQLAVRQAIEKAVHAMVLDGAERGYWAFADESRGQELIREYQAYRDEGLPSQPSGPVTATAPATPEPTPAAPPLAPRAEISSPAASPVVLAAAGGERALRPPSIGSPPDATNSGVRTDLRGRVLTTQQIIRVSIGDL